MKRNLLLSSLALLAITFFLSNCASLSGLQDGRTVGKGNGDFSASLNFTQSPDFNKLEDNVSDTLDFPNISVPSFEFGGRYGVAEKLDVTLRMNTFLNLGLGVKAQLVGDRESPFALAVGVEAGTFGLVTGLWNVQVPLYLSVHPTDKFAVYFNPRYIYQFTSYTGVGNGLTYVGGNGGIFFGKRNKFGIDVGYFNLSSEGGRLSNLFQIGIGGRFAFGDN